MRRKILTIIGLGCLLMISTISVFAANANLIIVPQNNATLIYVGIDIAIIPSNQVPQNAFDWNHVSCAKRILTRQKSVEISINETFPKGNYEMAYRILYIPVGEEDQNSIIIGNAGNQTDGWKIIDEIDFEIGKKQNNNSTRTSGSSTSTGTFHLLKVRYSLKNPDGYIYGYPDGTFRPNSLVTRAEFIAMLDRLVKQNQPKIDLGVKDIKGHWGYSSIKNWEAECVDITKDSQFHPDQPIMREEIADVCSKIFNSPQHPTEDFFSDIQTSSYRNEINDLGYAGIMKGYQGQFRPEFRPEDTLTRAELVTLLNQNFFSKKKELQTNIFTDIHQENWYYDNILRAIK